MKKSVELVSPQPTKGAAKEGGNGGGGGGGENKSENKKPEEKKSEEKKDKEKEKPKEPTVTTLQFKTRVHCDRCAHKIKRIVGKCEGVQEVNVDLAKDLITVKGTTDQKDLLPYLKLKRSVDLAPAKKDDGGDGGDKKPKEGGGGQEKLKQGGDKTDKPKEISGDASTSNENTTKIEVNKMEYSPFSYDYSYSHAYDPRLQGVGYAQAYDPRTQGDGYGHQVPAYWHAPDNSHPPQMFSDENPNACSVM